MCLVTSMLFLSVLVRLPNVSAQVQPEPGSRVRVTAPDIGVDKSVGRCLELSDGSMQFAPESGAVPVTIPFVSMTGLQVSRGRKSSVRKGALWGGLIGGAVGVAIGASMEVEDFGTEGFALAGVVAGAVIGAPIGAFIKTERWDEIPLDRLPVSLAPQRDGRVGLGFSVAF